MGEKNVQRPFQQRFLDGFERSRLRSEVQRSKKSRLSGLKKRYATMVLGASLAVGGIGFPLKSLGVEKNFPNEPAQSQTTSSASTSPMDEIKSDLATASNIAREVTGGVTAAADTIKDSLAPTQVANEAMRSTKEAAREAYFAKEVPFGKIIYQEAKKNDLPPELVAAVVQQESRFVPTARSHAGAQGLMQLVPRTGKWMGASNLMNPSDNVKAGAKYLRYLHDRFDGDSTKVIAAYNAGEGNVRRFRGVPPFKETQKYVKNVKSFQRQYDDQVSGRVAESLEQALPDSGNVLTAALR
jgi:soluble lytic murein transglycosylase-like protein